MSRRRCATNTALVLAALLCGARGQAQAPASEAEVKAAFVYNFLKFVEWPKAAFQTPKDSFVIAIIGDGATADATERLLVSKQLGGRPLAIRRLRWDHSLRGVHALFVSERDATRLRHILDEAADARVLSIGEEAHFATRGGIIALLIENRRVRFDIDIGVAQAAGLQVSSKLLALTRVVHTPNGAGARP